MASAIALEEWVKPKLGEFLQSRILPEFHRKISHEGAAGSPRLARLTPRSAIFRYELGNRAYAIRLEGPQAPHKHTTEAAFGWLERLREVDPLQQRLPVLPTVALLSQYHTMVTEWVPAPTIREVIVRRERAIALLAITRAFRWLEELHALDPKVSRPFRPHQRVRIVQRLRTLKDRIIPSGHRHTVDRSIERLTGLGAAIAGEPVSLCFLHHDASCTNFLFDGTRAIGFDLHETVRGNTFVDFCHFLVDADVELSPTDEATTPLALDSALQDLVLSTEGLVAAPNFLPHFRFHLLVATLLRYMRRLQPRPPHTVKQHARLIGLMEGIAGDDFALPA